MNNRILAYFYRCTLEFQGIQKDIAALDRTIRRYSSHGNIIPETQKTPAACTIVEVTGALTLGSLFYGFIVYNLKSLPFDREWRLIRKCDAIEI